MLIHRGSQTEVGSHLPSSFSLKKHVEANKEIQQRTPMCLTFKRHSG